MNALTQRHLRNTGPQCGKVSPLPLARFAFASPHGFHHPKTRIHVRLLGPCYKTGRTLPFHQHHQNDGACPSPSPIVKAATCVDNPNPRPAGSKHLPAPKALTPQALALLTSVPNMELPSLPYKTPTSEPAKAP